jgi:hypothetical protein
MPKIIWRP